MPKKTKKKTAKKGGTASAASRAKRITTRVVSSKRHTTGYMVGSRFLSVDQARSAAASGSIAGVRVVGNHIQATPGNTPLSRLPVKVAK